jgi:hypothetical protein
MLTLALIAVGLVAIAAAVPLVNARYDTRRGNRAADAPSPDDCVAEAWDAFGSGDAVAEAGAVSALLEKVDPAALEHKASLVRLAVMCVRTQSHAPLVALAERADAIEGTCAEATALRGLAEAYVGDPAAARTWLGRAKNGLAGCATCGAQGEGQLLLGEVALALDALAGEATNLSSAAGVTIVERADPSGDGAG